MGLLYWLFVFACAYFIVVFFILRLVVPFMGFMQYSPPTNLPRAIKQAISELESKSRDQQSYLQNVYALIMFKNAHQWKHTRLQAAIQLNKLFKKDLKDIWYTEGFVYCQAINFVIYTMLANSKFFKADDVRV